MSVLCFDGFSHYQSSDIPRKWNGKNDNYCTWSIGNAEGRNGSALKRVSTGNANGSGYLTRSPFVKQGSIWTPTQGGMCGFALKVDDITRITAGNASIVSDTLIAVYNGSIVMFGVMLNPNGTFTLVRYGSNTLLATSVGVVISGSWCYIEFKWLVHPTTGNFIIRANGIEIMNYSGVLWPDTFPGPSPAGNFWTSVNLFGLQSQPAPYLTLRVCDFYLGDLTAPNGDLLGDITVNYIIPDAAGAATAWTPSAGSNFQNVDEVPPTDDTDYNSATAPGTLDLYSFQPITVNPLAIQHCVLARRTIPGSATVKSVARHGGTNYSSPSQAIPNETYAYVMYPYDTNPGTGAKWTTAEVNAAEFGPSKDT